MHVLVSHRPASKNDLMIDHDLHHVNPSEIVGHLKNVRQYLSLPTASPPAFRPANYDVISYLFANLALYKRNCQNRCLLNQLGNLLRHNLPQADLNSYFEASFKAIKNLVTVLHETAFWFIALCRLFFCNITNITSKFHGVFYNAISCFLLHRIAAQGTIELSLHV